MGTHSDLSYNKHVLLLYTGHIFYCFLLNTFPSIMQQTEDRCVHNSYMPYCTKHLTCHQVTHHHNCISTVQNLKCTPVKRHHSTGDMLNNDIEYPSPVVPRRDKSRRPKSEGNFYVEAFRSKRASSFGVSTEQY